MEGRAIARDRHSQLARIGGSQCRDHLGERRDGDVVRALAGVPSGMLIWIAVAMIARSPTPERWSGIYLTIQTLAQFVPRRCTHGLGHLALGCKWRIRRTRGLVRHQRGRCYSRCRIVSRPWSQTTRQQHAERSRSVALAAPFLWMAFIVGVWVYAEPLSRQAGHAPTVAGVAVSISLACQVLGGATATCSLAACDGFLRSRFARCSTLAAWRHLRCCPESRSIC